eukprot:353000-Chlamydomonas_euryale.AAC.14
MLCHPNRGGTQLICVHLNHHHFHRAVKEKGAWLRQGTGEGRKQERIRAAKFGLQDKGLSIVGSSSHPSQQTAEFMELFDSPNTLQVGSSLKLLMVAEGSAHIYPRMVPCCEWDTAAADIIVSEAGGVVLQAGLCDHNGKALEDWKKTSHLLRRALESTLHPPDCVDERATFGVQQGQFAQSIFRGFRRAPCGGSVDHSLGKALQVANQTTSETLRAHIIYFRAKLRLGETPEAIIVLHANCGKADVGYLPIRVRVKGSRPTKVTYQSTS